jgi:hypothetical protein
MADPHVHDYAEDADEVFFVFDDDEAPDAVRIAMHGPRASLTVHLPIRQSLDVLDRLEGQVRAERDRIDDLNRRTIREDPNG